MKRYGFDPRAAYGGGTIAQGTLHVRIVPPAQLRTVPVQLVIVQAVAPQ